MNKKTLIWITIALLTLTFIFLLIGIFAAALPMTILGLVFTVGSIICLVIYMTSASNRIQ